MAAAATWPLLFDPARDDHPTATVLRQGALIVAHSPWCSLALVALEAMFAVAQVTVLAFAFVLPSLMVLVAGHVAVARADGVRRAEPASQASLRDGWRV